MVTIPKDILGPPTDPQASSTWGRRLTIRPGVTIAAGGTGKGPDMGNRMRLIDVRAPTAMPGQHSSASYVVYLTADVVFDSSFVPAAADVNMSRFLVGVLETGSGGITRQEQFIVPQHGRAIHIGADSVRLFVVYLPFGLRDQDPDIGSALIGFELNANVSVSGIYPGEVRQDTEIFNPLVPASLIQTFVIPEFSEQFQLVHPSAGSFNVTFQDQFGFGLPDFGVGNGASFVEPQPIPVTAARVSLGWLGTGIAGPNAPEGAAVLKYLRPS